MFYKVLFAYIKLIDYLCAKIIKYTRRESLSITHYYKH